ncbi:PREDICTED: GPI mannosyltransferase 1 [Dinoponera quadriceps]|uniref:GPI alpha-1,4-mannosyltransferase I, catalytic subunit n=1 Tax=Dinoponera quadriceps TaxID=609295 RepID=A0A6P3X974_DINQU|nr:PREDICTED: GPI mannosyltransferase 1 [Dinoponera quadriceps]
MFSIEHFRFKPLLDSNMRTMDTICRKISDSSFTSHCVSAFLVRLLLILYANVHDGLFSVPYTDVDYKVFTDAARYVTEGRSPFERHTYRYSPLLAWLLTPNVVLHKDFGKLLFSAADILIAISIRSVLARQRCNAATRELCALLWLCNPLTLVISTRGSADSLAVLLVTLTLDLLQRDKYVSAGLLHGVSVHFRLYPLMFSLPMYLSLRKGNRFLPNKDQWRFASSCVLSIIAFTATSYHLYGFSFLQESLLYHLTRKDARHNFSVYFYMLYLSADQPPDVVLKVLTFLPQLLLLLVTSYYYSEKSDLPFAMFVQAIIAVMYNPVLTSQYFFWFLSLLPLCLPSIGMSLRRCACLMCIWIASQAVWLLAAYLLEFQGFNLFGLLWLSGLLFFAVNVKVLVDIVSHYKM